MQDFFAALISFFLIEPLQSAMTDTLKAARAPEAVVAAVTSCAGTAAPVMIDRATSDPWWALTSAFKLWVGTAQPAAVLVEAAPTCATAINAASPYLSKQAS